MNKLFEGIVKDLSNADIGWMNTKNPFYMEGYKKAARELSDRFECRRPEEKVSLIFPIIFLYRQYIELTLKNLLKQIDCKLANERTDKILERHKLLPLWDETISQYDKFIYVNNIALVFTSLRTNERDIINHFNQVDEDSFSFRYAYDKKGNDNLEKIDYISVNNFRAQIELVIKYLEDMIETLSHIEFEGS